MRERDLASGRQNTAFEISTRMLVHFGVGSISSGAVALDELKNNGFDANSLKDIQAGFTVKLPSWQGE